MESKANGRTPETGNERGATMVEYALMVALILIGSVASIGSIGANGNKGFTKVNKAFALAQGGIE
jgi:Flp pilus assembly pilin Flp